MGNVWTVGGEKTVITTTIMLQMIDLDEVENTKKNIQPDEKFSFRSETLKSSTTKGINSNSKSLLL
jgi:hypothetical protein